MEWCWARSGWIWYRAIDDISHDIVDKSLPIFLAEHLFEDLPSCSTYLNQGEAMPFFKGARNSICCSAIPRAWMVKLKNPNT